MSCLFVVCCKAFSYPYLSLKKHLIYYNTLSLLQHILTLLSQHILTITTPYPHYHTTPLPYRPTLTIIPPLGLAYRRCVETKYFRVGGRRTGCVQRLVGRLVGRSVVLLLLLCLCFSLLLLTLLFTHFLFFSPFYSPYFYRRGRHCPILIPPYLVLTLSSSSSY